MSSSERGMNRVASNDYAQSCKTDWQNLDSK